MALVQRHTSRVEVAGRVFRGFVARPNAVHGLGFSNWELIFAPLTFVEGRVRSVLR